ncbi:MAG: aminoacyl-tRNA hydrolase [Myxococcales bacterium]|nr:aminoacyl-tRNA hydrolase [Myxococcales bacterium]
MWLVVGLGNPGPKYEDTRHNLGFMVETALRDRARAPAAKTKFGGETTDAELCGQRIVFLRPMEYMNLSGQSVGRMAGFWKIPPERVLVVHDELDVPFARLKLASGGGPGGHNGLKSLISHLGTKDFPRVRAGVGRPPPGRDPADYLLSRFSSDERKQLPAFVDLAADAVEAVVELGITAAMNRFNGRALGPVE